MPELPEVETIARSLRNHADLPWHEQVGMNTRPGIVGRTIASVQVLWERSIATPTPQEFQTRLVGQAVHSVERRGKFIVIALDTAELLFHLRMSGDLRVEPKTQPRLPHDRLEIDFSDGMKLVFNDTRKFGRVWLVTERDEVIHALGPEPFDPALTGQVLYQRIHGSRRAIKSVLLDQSVIAGVGNIYSDEALFLAGIHPTRPACDVTQAQAEALLAGIRAVMEEGIRRNGASIDWVYRGGDFQNYFKVYQRTGEPCQKCGTPIERRVIGQRSSHFCPHCQPK